MPALQHRFAPVELMKKAAAAAVNALCNALHFVARHLMRAVTTGWFLRFKYLEYVADPTDVFIVSYPRSGTTWMQMVLYQLTTNGRMDIPHISQVIPFFDRLMLPHRRSHYYAMPRPRIFKSHLPFSGALRTIPKGPCKYIYVTRNVSDVVVSYYHFHQLQSGFPGNLAVFFNQFIRGEVQWGSWFKHVAGWHRQRGDPRILFVNYEDLSQDLPGSVREIAEFCGVALDDEKMARVVERCSFEFMKAHEKQFDHASELRWEIGAVGSFIRKGTVGEGRDRLSVEQLQLLEGLRKRWLEFQVASDRKSEEG
jgi:hypothetical protein